MFNVQCSSINSLQSENFGLDKVLNISPCSFTQCSTKLAWYNVYTAWLPMARDLRFVKKTAAPTTEGIYIKPNPTPTITL